VEGSEWGVGSVDYRLRVARYQQYLVQLRLLGEFIRLLRADVKNTEIGGDEPGCVAQHPARSAPRTTSQRH
jgi:hypothetical protein